MGLDSCYEGMWKVAPNSLDIDCIHSDILHRAYKKYCGWSWNIILNLVPWIQWHNTIYNQICAPFVGYKFLCVTDVELISHFFFFFFFFALFAPDTVILFWSLKPFGHLEDCWVNFGCSLNWMKFNVTVTYLKLSFSCVIWNTFFLSLSHRIILKGHIK